MPRWDVFTEVDTTDQRGFSVLWYWRRTDADHVRLMPQTGSATLQVCVDDARKHGLTDEPINVMQL